MIDDIAQVEDLMGKIEAQLPIPANPTQAQAVSQAGGLINCLRQRSKNRAVRSAAGEADSWAARVFERHGRNGSRRYFGCGSAALGLSGLAVSSRSVFNRNCPHAASMSCPFSRRSVAGIFNRSSAVRNAS